MSNRRTCEDNNGPFPMPIRMLLVHCCPNQIKFSRAYCTKKSKDQKLWRCYTRGIDGKLLKRAWIRWRRIWRPVKKKPEWMMRMLQKPKTIGSWNQKRLFYTMQPVVLSVVWTSTRYNRFQPVVQPIASCKRIFYLLDNRLSVRLYESNIAIVNKPICNLLKLFVGENMFDSYNPTCNRSSNRAPCERNHNPLYNGLDVLCKWTRIV
jgi:hypothetical protein